MNKINLYIFNQIVKSCTLVFFIFVSIAWLMQISRIFTMMNNLNIQFLDILGLCGFITYFCMLNKKILFIFPYFENSAFHLRGQNITFFVILDIFFLKILHIFTFF